MPLCVNHLETELVTFLRATEEQHGERELCVFSDSFPKESVTCPPISYCSSECFFIPIYSISDRYNFFSLPIDVAPRPPEGRTPSLAALTFRV